MLECVKFCPLSHLEMFTENGVFLNGEKHKMAQSFEMLEVLSKSSVYVKAIIKKLQTCSNRKPASLRNFEN